MHEEIIFSKRRDKVAPVYMHHAMSNYGESEGKTPHILNLNPRWG